MSHWFHISRVADDVLCFPRGIVSPFGFSRKRRATILPGLMSNTRRCELCGREVSALTRHHLIPRTRHANKRNKREFDRAEVKKRIAWFCRPCHNHVHALFTEKILERELNTIEVLAAHPDVARFVKWIRNKPDGFRPANQPSHSKRRNQKPNATPW